MMVIKREEKGTRRRRIGMEDGDQARAKRCVKRQRRDHQSTEDVTLKVSDENQNRQQVVQADHDDQTSLAPTVKRSSKYRGVSRYMFMVN